ncbi:MAG TPA: glycine oxidase ThiO [Rhizomicrobium sp.]|nr:glycine oxidase ThiO [Rhizomicrobium sp.]
MNIVIIGAGVAGLGIGWRLLQAGCAVTILERAQPATGASWAAAGMLAVTAELEEAAEAERGLALRAHALWPGFAAELEAASGCKIFLSRVGALLLAADAAELEVMRAREKGELRILGRDQAQALVPLLGDTVGGLWSPHEAHVDNRALGEALAIAFLKAGGVLNANEAVVTLEAGPAVRTPYHRYDADAVVVAAGAWSALLAEIPIQPVKGEVILLTPPPGQVLPVPVVWGANVYCVPRPHLGENGGLLIGATVQEEGFDTRPTPLARDQLRAAAQKLMPSLKDWRLADHWAGLRPKSLDGLPLLGPSGRDGVFVAGGQYRNGILFAPAIAQEMADIVMGRGAVIPDFDPQRFGGRFA